LGTAISGQKSKRGVKNWVIVDQGNSEATSTLNEARTTGNRVDTYEAARDELPCSARGDGEKESENNDNDARGLC
jgi:hypothetical protein